MNAFNIIGPIMVGPSSSHTAGAARIANITGMLVGKQVKEAVIKLHGSFASTYRGHGTDKAIIGGLLGFPPDDIRLRSSLELAKQAGLSYSIQTAYLGDVHPNTVLIEAVGADGSKASVMGSSIGGGNIIIKEVNGMQVEFTAQFHTLLIQHTDKPGVIAFVAGLLSENSINIANMKVYRSCKGGGAVMVIETDQQLEERIVRAIKEHPLISDTAVISML